MDPIQTIFKERKCQRPTVTSFLNFEVRQSFLKTSWNKVVKVLNYEVLIFEKIKEHIFNFLLAFPSPRKTGDWANS